MPGYQYGEKYSGKFVLTSRWDNYASLAMVRNSGGLIVEAINVGSLASSSVESGYRNFAFGIDDEDSQTAETGNNESHWNLTKSLFYSTINT